MLAANLAVVPLTLVLYAAAPSMALAAVALVGVGVAYIGVLSGLGTVVQLRAPDAYRARILSLYMVALGVVYPIGAVLQGFVGDRVGLRAVTAACAGAYLALVLAPWAVRPGLAGAFDDPDHPDEAEVAPPAPAGTVA